jgi:RNA polymerase sigma factor (sigma-70 family)
MEGPPSVVPDEDRWLPALRPGYKRAAEGSNPCAFYHEGPQGGPLLLLASLGARTLSNCLAVDTLVNLAEPVPGQMVSGALVAHWEWVAEAFCRYAGNVNRVARRSGDGALTADDIVEDVFERLLRSPQLFDARRGTLGTYLKVQARSRSIDLARSERRRRQRELLDDRCQAAEPAEDEALAGLLRLDLRAGLARLPDDERATIELAYFGGLSYRAVAERLGIPEGTAKSRIRGGLFRLRASMRLQLTEN